MAEDWQLAHIGMCQCLNPTVTVLSTVLWAVAMSSQLLSRGCPMCNRGERTSILDGQLVRCPWCRATGRVPLERCRALRAQLRSKAEREAGT